jgi:phosphatidylinositol 4-kinase
MPEEPEEMDLVEQMYGAKLSVKDILPEWSEIMPLPQGPKNKALDAAAWDRAGAGAGGSPKFLSALNSPGGDLPDTSIARPQTPLRPISPLPPTSATPERTSSSGNRVITLEDYSERMRTAAVMLAQLNASMVASVPEPQHSSSGALSWIPGTGWIKGSAAPEKDKLDQLPIAVGQGQGGKLRLAAAQAAAIRDRIMEEMMALEEERVARMTARPEGAEIEEKEEGGNKTAEDENIVRRELNKADPSGKSKKYVRS